MRIIYPGLLLTGLVNESMVKRLMRVVLSGRVAFPPIIKLPYILVFRLVVRLIHLVLHRLQRRKRNLNHWLVPYCLHRVHSLGYHH